MEATGFVRTSRRADLPVGEHRYNYPDNEITQEVAYWRKANQIHRWFVDNVQDGEDDCDYHEVCTKGIIEELLNTCKRVLNSSNPVSEAKRWLPVQEGFFFGSYEYDEEIP